jgi:hypothetical protein
VSVNTEKTVLDLHTLTRRKMSDVR